MGVIPQPVAGTTIGVETAGAAFPQRGETSAGTPGWNVIVTLPEATAPRALRRWVRSTAPVILMSSPRPSLTRMISARAGGGRRGDTRDLEFHFACLPGAANFRLRDGRGVREEGAGRGACLGKRFHVRLHRRGLKGVLSTPDEERFLDETLLQARNAAGTPGHIGFDDADFVIHIERIDRRAGLSLWSRDEMQRYPLLGIS